MVWKLDTARIELSLNDHSASVSKLVSSFQFLRSGVQGCASKNPGANHLTVTDFLHDDQHESHVSHAGFFEANGFCHYVSDVRNYD
jgi:hypothetical protein